MYELLYTLFSCFACRFITFCWYFRLVWQIFCSQYAQCPYSYLSIVEQSKLHFILFLYMQKNSQNGNTINKNQFAYLRHNSILSQLLLICYNDWAKSTASSSLRYLFKMVWRCIRSTSGNNSWSNLVFNLHQRNFKSCEAIRGWHENLSKLSDIESDTSKIQADLNRMSEWTKIWQLSFNPEKCEVMRVTHLKDHTVPEYCLMGKKRKVVHEQVFKDLGVIMTSDLSWSEQVNAAANKANPTYSGPDQADS